MSNGLSPTARCCLLAAGLLLLATGLARAQIFVPITAAGYGVPQLAINVGDSVMWFNYDPNSAHTTTSERPPGDPNHWDVFLNYSQFYTRTFTSAGTFNYHDTVAGFTGTVIVSGSVPLLDSPQIVNGQFRFNVTGLLAGKTNVLYASTNLASWNAIQTNVAPARFMTLTNAALPGRNFYRLLELR